MLRVAMAVLLLCGCSLFSLAQSVPDPGKVPRRNLPTKNVDETKIPNEVSDTTAYLMWLLAASPTANDSELEKSARQVYLDNALLMSNLGPEGHRRLDAILEDFRASHDALVAQYNGFIASTNRDHLWVEYRALRTKENDLANLKVNAIAQEFPAQAEGFKRHVVFMKRFITQSFYQPTGDPNYAAKPETAATGFSYITAQLVGFSNSLTMANEEGPTHYETVQIIGMVPGCPGMVKAHIRNDLGTEGDWVEGPLTNPVEYISLQTTRSALQRHGQGPPLQGMDQNVVCYPGAHPGSTNAPDAP